MRRATVISLLVIVLIVAISAVMYTVVGSQGGFVGVPRLLPSSFASGTTGDIVNTMLYVLAMVVLFAVLGVAVYYMRGLKD